MLGALQERGAAGSEVDDLSMLLAYFITLDPSPQLFADLLARCANDRRPGVAESATVLRRSWERGVADAEPTPRPRLAEVLRTMGALLDAADARGAYLAVAPDHVRLQTFGERSVLDLGLHEVRQEIAAYMALRGQLRPDEAGAGARHETRLRTIGAELDQEPEQAYELAVLPSAIVVEGDGGYARVFTAVELASRIATSGQQRQPGAAAD